MTDDTAMTNVTDADREAAAELLSQRGFTDEWVQDCFARHREASIAPYVEALRKAREAIEHPSKHRFWGAGEPDCPPDIKAGNGELHTLRCKVCGTEKVSDHCASRILAQIDALLENAK